VPHLPQQPVRCRLMPFGDLDRAWRTSFELAWDALRSGSIPVGAVVVDAAGEVVAEGRNRIFESDAPRGQLAGSFLAHAELNALAYLDPVRRYSEHVLYTTLEPCALCVGAAIMVMVGRVSYASNDVYGGGSQLRLDNPHTARQPLVVEGPLDGIVGDLGELLHVAHFLWRKPDSIVVEVHRKRNPRIVELAERVDLMSAAQEGATLDDAMTLVGNA
jgi:tRNA(Arg) A34 adenosine deaminase TadA